MGAERLKVFFLGSGRIAVPVLDALRGASALELVGVATQPDRQAGRGRRLVPTPVGERAEAWGIPVDKPASVNSSDFLDKLRSVQPDMVLLVAFGQMLKAGILALPALGCVNMHASLLPRHRGASPIAASILAGDAATGVTFTRMEAGLDCGPVYMRRELRLTGSEYADKLEDDLGALGAEVVCAVLTGIAAGSLAPAPQEHEKATYARKIAKECGRVDWTADAASIERMVRAYHPWPGASCEVPASAGARRRLRITAAAVRGDVSGEPGMVMIADKSAWVVACGSGAVEIRKVVPEGKGEMGGTDFLRGARVMVGDRIRNSDIVTANQ